jgi:hypothetical protein
MRVAAVLGSASALVSLLVGCGSLSTTPVRHSRCSSGVGEPISVRQMTKSLRVAGLMVSPDRSLCDRDTVTDLVTAGYELSCTVYQRVVYPKMNRHPRMRFEGLNYSGKAYVIAYANVDCWDYATGSRRDAISTVLRRIFRTLGATSRKIGRY